MPRTKKLESRPPPQAEPEAVAMNGLLGDVLTLAEAAAYPRLPEQEVVSAVHTLSLPGRLVGGDWRFLKAAIQQWLSTPAPTAETRKAAQLALAGKYKDDPQLEEILEEAMQRRGRSLRPDGTYSGYNPG